MVVGDEAPRPFRVPVRRRGRVRYLRRRLDSKRIVGYMALPPKLKRTQQRHFSAHHLLLSTAWGARERAIKRQPGWKGDALVVLLLSALAIEAMCNAIGERVIDEWLDFETSRPDAKLRILATALSVEYNNEEEP